MSKHVTNKHFSDCPFVKMLAGCHIKGERGACPDCDAVEHVWGEFPDRCSHCCARLEKEDQSLFLMHTYERWFEQHTAYCEDMKHFSFKVDDVDLLLFLNLYMRSGGCRMYVSDHMLLDIFMDVGAGHDWDEYYDVFSEEEIVEDLFRNIVFDKNVHGFIRKCECYYEPDTWCGEDDEWGAKCESCVEKMQAEVAATRDRYHKAFIGSGLGVDLKPAKQ